MYRVLLFFLLLFAIVFFYLNTMESDILGSDIIGSYMGSKENFTSEFKDILPIQIGGDNNSISVPNTIGGNNTDSNDPFIAFQGDIRIKHKKCIEFAKGFNKEVDAGKIGYQVFGDLFDIVGAGSNGVTRKVKIWDHLETGTIKTINGIECQTLNITSDERIKHKKMVLDPNDSLAQINHLKPTQFEFKSGGAPVYGFIAQEVQQVVPTCVTSQKSYIANIHDRAILTGNQLTFKEFDTKDLEYKDVSTKELSTKENSTKDSELYPNLKLKRDGQERHVSITRIVDEHTVEVKDHAVEVEDVDVTEDLKEGMKDGEYLVYGQEVDDFLTIDKNQLFALTTSGLQALDAHQQALANDQQALHAHQQALANQQQVHESRVQELEHQLQEEREQNKTTLHRILQRISSLEAK